MNTIKMAIKALEASGEDCIRRQEVLDAFWKLDVEIRPSAIDVITKMINDIPSVTPQQKVGRWRGTDEWYHRCSVCKEDFHFYYRFYDKWKYCPNCGANMEGAEE